MSKRKPLVNIDWILDQVFEDRNSMWYAGPHMRKDALRKILEHVIAIYESTLDERSRDSEPASGVVDKEDMHYLVKVQTHHRQYMIGLENRIAELERAEREREGEL